MCTLKIYVMIYININIHIFYFNKNVHYDNNRMGELSLVWQLGSNLKSYQKL
jgi:hypothetical protein